MAVESMGHALEWIHSLLKPTGCLIDLHPNGEPPPITVHIEGEDFLVGWVREASDYIVYDETDEALETAVSTGLFRWTTQETFAFLTYFDALTELQHYLETEWSAAYLEETVAMQIETRMQVPTADKRIVLEEIVKIGRLEKLPIS